MGKSNAFVKTFPVVWIVTIIVAGALVLFGETILGISYALGSVTSLMTMSMLYKSSLKVIESTTKEQAQKVAWKNYGLRYLMYVLILVTSAIHENLNVFLVAAGIITFKICLYIVIYFTEKGDKND